MLCSESKIRNIVFCEIHAIYKIKRMEYISMINCKSNSRARIKGIIILNFGEKCVYEF